jgi:glyoxylase-like metal-dependent hydrolase (beta-lactamase superfamily II)
MIDFQLKSAGFCYASKHHALRGAEKKTIQYFATYGLIRHPEYGVILFDVGYSQRFFDCTEKLPYRIYQFLTKVKITPEEEVVNVLRSEGIEPEEVKYIILSHFHADHIGGLKDFPKAKFIAGKVAYEAIKDKKGWAAMLHGYVPMLLPDDFESRLQLIEIEKGTYYDKDLGKLIDVFGDGSILLCDLNGHAIGQIGAVLNTNKGTVFLIADACWLEETYKENWLPNPIVRLITGSWKGFLASLKKVQSYYKNNPETVIIPCHCEATMRRFWEGQDDKV